MAITTEQLSIVMPAHTVPGPQQGEWTYQEYAALPDDGQRYEIMDGILLIAPAPSLEHQSISKYLAFYLCQYGVFCIPPRNSALGFNQASPSSTSR